MESTKHDDAEIHAEIEHLEELWVWERQHDDAKQLCQCYTTQHLQTSITCLTWYHSTPANQPAVITCLTWQPSIFRQHSQLCYLLYFLYCVRFTVFLKFLFHALHCISLSLSAWVELTLVRTASVVQLPRLEARTVTGWMQHLMFIHSRVHTGTIIN